MAVAQQLSFDAARGAKPQERYRSLEATSLLAEMPALQQLMHRLLGCDPEGAATKNHVVGCALVMVLQESFQVIRCLHDGIINLVDKFFDME